MTAETKPASVGVEGNDRIKFLTAVPAAAADWDAGTDVTYSFTPDGWNPTRDQATVTDDRLSAAQTFEQPGKVTASLTVKYVDSTTGATASLVQGTAGYIGVRSKVLNATAGAVSQKVEIWPVICGIQSHDAPVANGVFTISQKLFVTGDVTQVTLTA